MAGSSGVLVLSPRRGLLVSVDLTKSDGHEVPFLTGVLANDRTALWLPSRNSRLDFVADRDRQDTFSSLKSSLNFIIFGVNRPGQKGQGRFQMGYGFSNRRRPDQAPFEVNLTFPVVSAINAFDQPEWKATWQAGALLLSRDGHRLRIDETTGQLLDAQVETENNGVLAVRVGEGLFDQELARYDRASRDVPNEFDPKARWESSARFLISAACDAKRSAQRAVPGGEKVPLLENDVADRIQNFVNNPRLLELVSQFVAVLLEDPLPDNLAQNFGQRYFWIPQDFSFQQKHPYEAWAPLTMVMSDEWVGHDSWLWKLGRLSSLILLGENKAAETEFRVLFSQPKTGPLTWWTSSCVLGWVAPQWQKLAADVGQRRLKRGEFQRDVEGLLQQGGRLQRASERLGQQIRNLSDEELAIAVAVFADETSAASLLRQWRRWIRAEEFSDADLLPMLLDSLWQPLLQESLTEALIARQNCGGASLSWEMIQFLDHLEGRAPVNDPSPPAETVPPQANELMRLMLQIERPDNATP